jgi:quercetin dioxygenase-like cupin family protein
MAGLAIVGPLGIRRLELAKKCDVSEGHTHNYDHTTIVIRGGVICTYKYEKDGQIVEGESVEFRQGEAFEVKARVHHTLKATEDNTIYYCCFSHRDLDGVVCQRYTGNAQAYQ